jgi:hypothetical protein
MRLKESVEKYDVGLKEILQINPITFQYKKDNELKLNVSGKQVGISAQELQKLIPDSVKKSSKDYLQFQMDYVNWSMLNSIKELTLRLRSVTDLLEKEKDVIAKENSELKLRLAKIESKLGL